MTLDGQALGLTMERSQSAFVRGFIDDTLIEAGTVRESGVSIRVRARLHR